MGYVSRHLIEDERVLAWGKFSWVFEYRPIIVTGFLAGASYVAWAYGDTLLQGWGESSGMSFLGNEGTVSVIQYIIYGLMVISAITWLYGAAVRWLTEIALTNRRLIYKRGWLARNVEEIALNQMEEFTTKQSLVGRIFNYGSLSIKGTGVGGVTLPRQMSDPFGFRKKVAQARADYMNQTA